MRLRALARANTDSQHASLVLYFAKMRFSFSNVSPRLSPPPKLKRDFHPQKVCVEILKLLLSASWPFFGTHCAGDDSHPPVLFLCWFCLSSQQEPRLLSRLFADFRVGSCPFSQISLSFLFPPSAFRFISSVCSTEEADSLTIFLPPIRGLTV